METMRLNARSDSEGALTIQLPPAMRNRELEVVVVMQALPDTTGTDEASASRCGWPEGFFESTYGSLASDPIERLPSLMG